LRGELEELEVRIREIELLQLVTVNEKNNRAMNLNAHQNALCPSTRILEILDTEASISEI
jgi:hypothetical protein